MTNFVAKSLRAVCLIIAVVVAMPSLAELKVGDAITLPQLADQFDAAQTLHRGTKWVLFSHDMDSTNIVRDALTAQSAETMQVAAIQFYADISGMPALISRFIAIPKLKKLAYPIVLARDKSKLQLLPREENKATVIRLKQGKVQAITMVKSMEQLQALIAL